MPDFELGPAPVDPLDMSTLGGMPATPPSQPPSGMPMPKQGGDKRQWLKLAMLLPLAARQPGGVEGLLQGWQQAQAQKQGLQRQGMQDQRQGMLDQRQATLDQQNQAYRVQQQMLQADQQRQTAERQREADRLALIGEVQRAVTSVDSPEAVRSLLSLYGARAQALGMPVHELEAFVLEQATPTALQQRSARSILGTADKQWGEQASQFTYAVPGEDQPVPYRELQRRAGFVRDANAQPAGQTYAELFPETKALPIGSQRVPMTAAGVPNLDAATTVLQRMGVLQGRPAGARQRGGGGTTATATQTRQQESRLDEEVAFLLRNPDQATRQRWAALVREYEGLGVNVNARRDAVARRVEQEDRRAAGEWGGEVPPSAAERIAGVDAVVRGGGAPGAGAQPRSASRADVRAVAERLGVSEDAARQQLEAAGVVVR